MVRLSLCFVLLLAACGFVGIEAQGTADGGVDRDSEIPRDARTDRRSIDGALPDEAMDGADDAGIGPVYYLSPEGTEGAPGTREAPFRTFSEALARLRPGSTLVLLSGRYSVSSGTGLMHIDCREESNTCDGAPCRSGSTDAPIVVRADEERQAQIHAEPGDPDYMGFVRACEHYRIEGLTFRGADVEGNPWHSLNITQSANVIARRNLFMGNNRFVNSHLLLVNQSRDVLIEENELYDFHRAGISVYRSSNVTVRRNYVNARDYADIPGGRDSGFIESGDSAYSCSHSAGCLFENNVSDGRVSDAFGLNTSLEIPGAVPGEGNDARFLGNLVIGSRYGLLGTSACGGADDCDSIDELVVDRPLIQHNVFLNTEFAGVLLRGVREALVDHNTFSSSRIRVDVTSSNTPLSASARVTNNSIVNAVDAAIVVESQASRFVGFNNSFGDGDHVFFDGTDEGVGVHTNLDPQNGVCLHRNLADSPLVGMGEDGGSIGATVIRRYENGVLQSARLWASDGAFPCGALVAGINDTGARCANVHERFNIGACPIE